MKSDAPYVTAVDSPVEAIAGVNTNFLANQVKICQSGQDEVFDNCQLPENTEEQEDGVDFAAANPTDDQIGSKAYGFAAMDFLKGVSNELDPNGNFMGEQCSCVTIVHCSCAPQQAPADPEEIPLPEEAAADPEKAEEVVQEEVKKAREIADEKVEAIVEKEETKKDGLIDLMSKTLAKNARTKQEIQDNRSEIMSMVTTRIAAATELGTQTRSALEAGLKATAAK